MLTYALVVGLAAALPSVPTREDEKLPDAAAVLDKMEAAIGGREMREKLTSLVMKGDLEISDPKAPKTPFLEVWRGTREVKWTTPAFDSDGDGVAEGATQGSTGEFCWSEDGALGVTIQDGPEQGTTARYFAIGRRAPWRSLYESASVLKRETFDGRPHYVLQMNPAPPCGPETWYVDCETSLPSGYASKLPDPQGGAFDFSLAFSDWKAVSGIQFPHLKQMTISGFTISYRYTSIVLNAELDAAASSPPERVLAARKDPTKRSPQAGAHGVCAIEPIAAQETLTLREPVKETEVSKALATMYQRVGGVLAKRGASFGGPPFARFHSTTNGSIDLEAGIPVQTKVEGDGAVKATTLPGGKAAVTWHIGPYQDLMKTVKILEDWMRAQGLEATGGFWEVYWTDPGLEPDPSKWRTQIIWPIRS